MEVQLTKLIQFEEGMKVKIVAPKGFNLDEDYCEDEWREVHYFEFMKVLVGKTVQITGNAFDPERNCVEVFYENEIYEFPVSWVFPLDKSKVTPTAKDFLGQVIKVGDEVVYARPDYREFEVGKILKLTPTGARIKTGKNPYSGEPLTFFQTFNQIVKKP
jgi:hypothetical protein